MPFVEWMVGFPPGWVDGIPRTAALRCLGNAVLPQVAALARSVLTAESIGRTAVFKAKVAELEMEAPDAD